MMNTLLIAFVIGVVFVVLLIVWNKFSLKYNHGILRNSTCKNCGKMLGDKALNDATVKLQVEKEQLKREAKLGTVKLHNMELVCPNCGTINFERDLYKTDREKKK